jgi:uncharacterized protein (TIGR02246 family)
MKSDEARIQDAIYAWLEATKTDDLERIQTLIDPEVQFLTTGNAPFGLEEFLQLSQANAGKFEMEAQLEVIEIRVLGGTAYSWTHLRIKITPPSSAAFFRSGEVLSVWQKDLEGTWRIFRDANLLSKEP